MGVTISAVLVYGFEVEEASDDEERIESWQEEKGYEQEKMWTKESGVEVFASSSGTSNIFILGIASTARHTSEGNPTKVELPILTAEDKAAMDGRLHVASDEIGITPKQGSWLLHCWWS